MSVNRLLTFECSGQRYALRLGEVAALDRLGALRSIPGASPEVLGLANRRGRVVTVLDACRLLGGRPCNDGVLVFLGSPLDRTALYVPSPVRVRSVREGSTAADGEASLADPEGLRLLDARRLVDAVRARNPGGQRAIAVAADSPDETAGTCDPWT